MTNLPNQEMDDKLDDVDESQFEMEVLDEYIEPSEENHSEENDLSDYEMHEQQQEHQSEENYLSDTERHGYQSDENAHVTKQPTQEERRLNDSFKEIVPQKNTEQPNSSKKNKTPKSGENLDKDFSETLGTFNKYLKNRTETQTTSKPQDSLSGFVKLVDTLYLKVEPSRMHLVEKKILDILYEEVL